MSGPKVKQVKSCAKQEKNISNVKFNSTSQIIYRTEQRGLTELIEKRMKMIYLLCG